MVTDYFEDSIEAKTLWVVFLILQKYLSENTCKATVARGFTGVNPSYSVRWEAGAEQFTLWQQQSEKEDVPVSFP